MFSHTHGKGGKSGRVLMIWDKPFESEGEAVEFALGGEDLTTHPHPTGCERSEAKTPSAREGDLLKIPPRKTGGLL